MRFGAVVKQCELDAAIRRALNLFELWNGTTGFVEPNSGYHSEIQGVIEDAVHCGAQAATGDFKRLDGEPRALFAAIGRPVTPEGTL